MEDPDRPGDPPRPQTSPPLPRTSQRQAQTPTDVNRWIQAKVYRARGAGSAIGDLLVLSPNRHTDPDFLAYVLLSRVFLEQVNASTYGAKMPRASWDFIKTIRVIAPPLTKQRAIADFLDRETAKIDALIAKAERFIELAKERRAALITAAVTGQLEIPGVAA